MKKSLILVIILVLSLSIFFCGCIKKDDKLRGSTQDDTSEKPQHTNYLSYVIGKECPLGQDIVIELSFGTRITKSYIDTYPEENVAEPYKLIISAIGVEGEYNIQKNSEAFQKITAIPQDTSKAILIVDNFCMENYPFSDDKNEPVTTKVILSQSLFMGNKGSLWIAFHFYDNVGVELFYTIEEDTIFLSKQKS